MWKILWNAANAAIYNKIPLYNLHTFSYYISRCNKFFVNNDEIVTWCNIKDIMKEVEEISKLL